MENIFGRALIELKKTSNPGKVLEKLYRELYSLRFSEDTVKQFHRLSRNYGRYRVYYALANIADYYFGKEDKLNTDNPYPLVASIIKSEMKKELDKETYKEESSLQDYVNEYREALKQRNAIVVPDTFEDIDGN